MAADIRPACASDVDALLAIENAVFQTDRLQRASFRRLIGSASAAVIVAEADGAVAGYCVVLFREGSSISRLYSVATAPALSGQGIGRTLLAAAEREVLVRGRGALRLEVREDNRRAIAIYERAGFRPIGREAGYYQDGMTALRLEKHLGGEAPVEIGRGKKETFADSGSFSRLIEKTPRRAAP